MRPKKKVKLKDIADALGVSVVTASNALAGRTGVSEELREKVFAKADELGYQYAADHVQKTSTAIDPFHATLRKTRELLLRGENPVFVMENNEDADQMDRYLGYCCALVIQNQMDFKDMERHYVTPEEFEKMQQESDKTWLKLS